MDSMEILVKKITFRIFLIENREINEFFINKIRYICLKFFVYDNIIFFLFFEQIFKFKKKKFKHSLHIFRNEK